LGVYTGFIGQIGDDVYGNYYKDDLAKYKVNSHLVVSPGAASGIATTFISKDGERTFGTFLGAAALLNADGLKESDFEGYDYFYIEGYLVQNLDLIRTAIDMAKKAGAKVVLDMASYNVVEANRDFLLEIISKYVDIVFANEEEAYALLSMDPENALGKLAEWVDIAIVKTGAQGSWIQRKSEKYFVPALKVNCVDTTGAGDLYASGFLYGLINGLNPDKCGRIGTLLAGNVIQFVGPKMDEERWDELFSVVKSEALA
jgi:sugar/nucleoside kinase (ribokinase family)